MAGHSKWHNIQHRKKGQDAKRAKIFTKLIREITVAARMGGVDENSNPRLRAAIDKALNNNMSKDVILRAVKRGSGDDDGSQLLEVTYEGYGPNGVAVMVECLTDNKNRTVAEVRHAFTKYGGNLGTDGSVAYLFNKVGMIHFDNNTNEDKILEVALEAGADDVTNHDDNSIDVICPPNELMTVKEALVNAGLKPKAADVTMLATTEVSLDEEQAKQMVKLSDMLEDLDDVQNVYSNADIAEEILDKL